MKYLELYEDIDWTEDDFDFEEEESFNFKIGDKVYLSAGKPSINTIEYSAFFSRGKINGKYKLSRLTHKGIITEIRKMKDGTPVFRLKGEWPFRKFDNWIKK